MISLCCLPLCKHLHLSLGQIRKTTMLIWWSNSILMQVKAVVNTREYSLLWFFSVLSLKNVLTQKVQKQITVLVWCFFVICEVDDDTPFFMIYFCKHFYFSKKPFCMNVLVDKILLAKALSTHSFHKSFKKPPFQWIFILYHFSR